MSRSKIKTIIEIINFQGNEYVVKWIDGMRSSLDEGHINEYYEKITDKH